MSTGTAPHTGASRRVSLRMDALVDRARARLGRHYFHGLVLATGVLVVGVTVPLQNLTQVPFWTQGFGFGPSWYVGIFVAIAAVTAPVVLGLLVLPRHPAVIAHLRGEDADPAEVWRECVTRLPRTATVTTVVWGSIIIGIGVAVVGVREDFEATTYLGAYAAHALILVGVGAFYLMVYELALLPIANEVAGRLPADFAERSRVTGRRRLMLLNTSITFTVGCEAAGLSLGFMHQGQAWIVVAVTLGLMSTYVGVLLMLVSSSVSRRVDELSDALNGVANGEASVRILPTSGDEFDSVGLAFNRMVDLLDEHAAELRGSRTRLVEVADGTRKLIERDLHDGAQQSLALVSMQLGQLEAGSAPLPHIAPRVKAVRSELGAVVAEMRALAHGIYPASLEAEGLGSALRAAARESDVMVTLDLAMTTRWPPAVERAVYFCCWEVLQRCGQGAKGEASVAIALAERSGTGLLEIAVQPTPTREQAVDLGVFLQDRLGAVGGSVRLDADGPARYQGEVPTC